MSRMVDEWIGSSDNAAIPPRVRLRIFERDQGRCKNCTRKVGPGHEPYEIDHITALVNGGAHRESNLQILCAYCHSVKTGADVAEKARNYRKRSKEAGTKGPSRHVIPGSKRSGWRHTISNGWVRR